MSFLNLIMKKNADLYSALWAIVAAFGTYFCMYGFRKPFTAASFSEIEFFGFDFKTILVASQVLGYTFSKFIGIKFISEMPYQGRAVGILVLVGFSHISCFARSQWPAPVSFGYQRGR